MSLQENPRRSWRLRVYPTVVLATLGAALLLATVVYDVDDPESRLGGDYPSFYGAGAIVQDGDWGELFDAGRQQEEQSGLIDDDGGYLYFSYPPFVAGVYGILAVPGYQWSFLIHTLFMVAALAGAIIALWPWLERYGLPGRAVFVVALAFQPVLMSVIGGQNTALSLLLFALAARLDRDDRQVAAGLVISLLLFKPQFGVVALPLLLLARRWRSVLGWVVGATSLFVISTLLMGGDWVGDWWSQASVFSDINLTANGAKFISLPGFAANLFGPEATMGLVIGWGLAAIVGAYVAWVWWRAERLSLWHWSLAAGAAMAVAPQTLYYDAGLLLIGLVAVLPRLRRRSWLVAGLIVLTWAQAVGSALSWSPLGPVALAGFCVLLVAGPGQQPESAV